MGFSENWRHEGRSACLLFFLSFLSYDSFFQKKNYSSWGLHLSPLPFHFLTESVSPVFSEALVRNAQLSLPELSLFSRRQMYSTFWKPISQVLSLKMSHINPSIIERAKISSNVRKCSSLTLHSEDSNLSFETNILWKKTTWEKPAYSFLNKTSLAQLWASQQAVLRVNFVVWHQWTDGRQSCWQGDEKAGHL